LCGSWSAALEQAGCPVGRVAPELPYGERIEQARRMAAAGHTPAVIASHIGVSPDSVRRYLRAGSCRKCGAPVTASATGYCARCIFQATHVGLYTRAELLQRLREWHEQTGEAPRCTDWGAAATTPPNRYEREYPHWPPASSATATFGSWRAMLRAAGMQAHQREPWTRQDILDALRDGAQRLGRSPTVALAKCDGPLPSVTAVSRHFATWNAGLHAAGLEVSRIAPRDWDKAQILAALRGFERNHGRAPTAAEFAATDSAPAANTVAAHFGSWNAALDAAGVARLPRPLRWDDAAVLAALREFSAEHGRRPKARDFAGANRDGRWPSPSTVALRFGSWSNAVRAAGL
jgi:hypothetical protein